MGTAVHAWDGMSDAAKELLFAALDYAVENAEISEDGFVPFAMHDGADGTRGLTRFVAEGQAEGVQAGREALATVPEGTRAVALAWDGYVTYEDRRTEAVFVEAQEVGAAAGVLFLQRYLRVDGKVETLGNPLLHGETDPLVRATGDSSGGER
ncbi:hypothetical protein [Kitasatospora phosalacinea]|uniref:SnoaL-like domain-containing protein n=1 Tax=Kitasatospora phosalacinea TaxID=2065 RepID=A0ABW6GSS2_9ACTN